MLMFKTDTFKTKLFRRIKNNEMNNNIPDKCFQKRTGCKILVFQKYNSK